MKEKRPNFAGKTLRKKQLIEVLKKQHLTVEQLAEHFKTTASTIYRDLEELNDENDDVEIDFDSCYFIAAKKAKPEAVLCAEEWKFVKKLVRASLRTVLRDTILKKLTDTDLKETPLVVTDPAISGFMDQLEKAIKTRHQILLIDYHSANSSKVSTRLVEPVRFGDNYQTIVACDTADGKCKHFKIERIGGIEIKRTRFKFEHLHEQAITDVFGYTGKTMCVVTLKLTLRANLSLREEYALARPHITKQGEHFIFKAPVSHYEGIGRFVLSHLNDIKVLDAEEFRAYLLERVKMHTL